MVSLYGSTGQTSRPVWSKQVPERVATKTQARMANRIRALKDELWYKDKDKSVPAAPTCSTLPDVIDT